MTEKAGKRIIKEILIFVICGVLAVLIETLVFNRNAIAGKKVEFCISENSEISEEIENVERKNAVSSVEVVISAAILAATVVVLGWLAAKIFRFGTLMYGNPIKFTQALKKIREQ